MKKRIKSGIAMLLLALILVQPSLVSASEAVTISATPQISEWAYYDMVFAETYGIYSEHWLFDGFNTEITPSRFRNLISRVRLKILDTECVIPNNNEVPIVVEKLTVKEAISIFYVLLDSYDYPVDMGLDYGLDPVTYMTLLGIYTGENGEQGLDEIITVEQSVIMAARLIAVLYESVEASSKGFFWEVNAGENKVYLLGSIHVAAHDIYPFSSKIWKAFHESDGLIVEANLYDTSETEEYLQLVTYPEGETLANHVDDKTYQNVIAVTNMLGISEEKIASYKAWELYLEFSYLCAQLLNPDTSASAALGIDMTLMNQAVITQKPIYQIEGAKQQALMLDSFSDELQEVLLGAATEQLKLVLEGKESKEDSSIGDWYEMWKSGDVEGFSEANETDIPEELINEAEKALVEEYQLKFLIQRNENMASYVNELLKLEGKNTYFVVVGALHYTSDHSIIDILEESGYTVTQIK